MASKTMLGCDMSHWDSGRYRNIIPDMDFVIIKATEGKTSKDRYLDILYNFYTSVQDARGVAPEDRCFGFYHYAHPELNHPEEEAENFLRTIGHHAGKALLCLDWEGKAWKCSPRWARAWCDYVYRKTGVKPLLYTSSSFLGNLGCVAEGDYGLWVAKYSKTKPKTAPWKFAAMWQYSSDPYDHDIFYGDSVTWHKYTASVKNG